MEGDEVRITRENQQEFINTISTALFRHGVGLIKKHYIVSSLWLLGLIILTFINGLSVSELKQVQFQQDLSKIDMNRLYAAERQVVIARDLYYNSKGFLSCDEFCMENWDKLKKAEYKLDQYKAEDSEILSNARAKVGIFSEYAVSDAKELFWSTFSGGKEFATKMSKWDLIFMGISSMNRDEGLVQFILRFMFQMIINFTLALIGAFIAFIYYVGGLVSSYQPDPISAITFMFLATLSAASLIATYLLALYFTAAGTAYVVIKVAGSSLRIDNGNNRQPRYISSFNRDNRPHFQ